MGSAVNSGEASVGGHAYSDPLATTSFGCSSGTKASSLGCSENSFVSWEANTGSSGTSKISFSADRGVIGEVAANSVTPSEPSSPVCCAATAGTTSGACSSTGPTDSKNGSPTDADSSGCDSIGTGSLEGCDFELFNPSKAPPGFGEGDSLFRKGGFHGLSWTET